MTVLLLGGSGLLGRHLNEELVRRGQTVVAPARQACRIEDDGAVAEAVASSGCSLVVNAAAFTDVDAAERQAERAFEVNGYGAENVARAAAAAGATVVQVSTDFVFAGDQERPHDEWDEPRPGSVYAQSKRAGEVLVARVAPRHHVVRVQGLYGEGGRNFASKLHVLLLDPRAWLKLDDQRRVQPTWARDAARAVCDIAASDRFGTWHAACRGATTWHRFALAMAHRLGVEPSFRAVRSADLSLPANRPANCLLAGRRMAMCRLPPLPEWQDSLSAYMDELEKT
jgi:dTDP-4-dehydrorhamnose reductase